MGEGESGESTTDAPPARREHLGQRTFENLRNGTLNQWECQIFSPFTHPPASGSGSSLSSS